MKTVFYLLSFFQLVIINNAFAVNSLSLEYLEQLSKKHYTPEALLNAIPMELKTNYALIYGTNSPQAADFKHPRIVLFDETARFLLALNDQSVGDSFTDKTQTHSFRKNIKNHHFETRLNFDILEFDSKKKAYFPSMMQFSEDGSTPPKIDRNPKDCAICHSTFQNIQPIRKVYLGGIFPGFYGSVLDQVTRAESKPFISFLENEKKQGRYQYFPPQKSYSNTRLGILLNRRYFDGLSVYLTQNQKLHPFRYAILAALECTKQSAKDSTQKWDSQIENYLPDTVKQNFKFKFAQVLEEYNHIQKARFQEAIRKRNYFLKTNTQDIPQKYLNLLAPNGEETTPALAYLLKNLITDDPVFDADLNLQIRSGSDGKGSNSNLARSYNRITLDQQKDAELFQMHRQYEAKYPSEIEAYAIAKSYGPALCSQLKTKSLEALSQRFRR